MTILICVLLSVVGFLITAMVVRSQGDSFLTNIIWLMKNLWFMVVLFIIVFYFMAGAFTEIYTFSQSCAGKVAVVAGQISCIH